MKTIQTKVIFEIFGVYTHGKLEGKTNPKASALVTLYGESFKDCKQKLNHLTGGALWKVCEVREDIEFTGAYA